MTTLIIADAKAVGLISGNESEYPVYSAILLFRLFGCYMTQTDLDRFIALSKESTHLSREQCLVCNAVVT